MKYIGLIGGKSGDLVSQEIQKRGYKVALVCGKENEQGFDIADKVFVKDLSNKKEILEFFLNLGVTEVIISTGHILAFELADYLEKNQMKISIDVKTSFLCKDKYALKEKMLEYGFDTPKFLFFQYDSKHLNNLEKITENFNFPLVLKPNTDKLEPIAVHNKEELYKYYYKIVNLNSNILVEELIIGSDLTVPVLYDGENIKSIGIMYWAKGSEDKLIGFEASKSYKINNEEAVIETVEKLIKKINVLGLSRADLIVTEDKIYFLEINSVIVCGNLGGTYTKLWISKGYNFASLLVDNAFRIFNLKECDK